MHSRIHSEDFSPFSHIPRVPGSFIKELSVSFYYYFFFLRSIVREKTVQMALYNPFHRDLLDSHVIANDAILPFIIHRSVFKYVKFLLVS